MTDVLILNTGAAMDDQGEAIHGIADLLELIEGDVGLGLVLTMVGTDSDGKGVDAGLLDELDSLLGIGVAHIGIGNGDTILGTADGAKLGLDRSAVGLSHLDDALGTKDVLLEGKRRAVKHYRAITGLESLADLVEVLGVVEVEDNVDAVLLGHGLAHSNQVAVANVASGALGGLDDHGGVQASRDADNRRAHLEVMGVESTNGHIKLVGLCQDFAQGYVHSVCLLLSPLDVSSGDRTGGAGRRS